MVDPRVYILDGGTLVIDSAQVHWNVKPGTPVRFPVYSVLVEHEDARILYDTGYDLDHVNEVLPFELPEQESSQTIPAQLERCGLSVSDIDIIVNSHFHFDHVGGNRHFNDVRVLMHVEELRHARVPEPFEKFGYSDLSFDHQGSNYQPISGDHEIVPGVTLYETPGHTVGHYSMLVTMRNESSMLFCGDAAYTPEALTNEWVAGFHNDPTSSVRSIRRLNDLARLANARMFPSHDMESFNTWKLAPEYYGGN